jgi:hypothetical protein
LSDVDRQALTFLTQGPDTPGAVVDETVMAAHFVYLGLVDRGLASKQIGDDGPVYSINEAGIAALSAPMPN